MKIVITENIVTVEENDSTALYHLDSSLDLISAGAKIAEQIYIQKDADKTQLIVLMLVLETLLKQRVELSRVQT